MLAEQQNVRSYPRPFGINLAHVLGYLSPVTEDEYDLAAERDDRSLNGASVVGRAGVEKQYDEWLRGLPGYRRVAVDSMGRVLGDDSLVESTPGDTLVTSIDAKVQSVVERQLAERIAFQRTQLDTVTGRKYAADSGAAVVLDAKTGRVIAMASQPTYDPDVWTGGISEDAADPALLREGRHAAALARHPGPVRPGLDVEAVHDRRRADQRLLDGHDAAVLLGLPGRQPRLQELRVRRLRQHRLRQGARGLLQHVLLPRRLRLLAALRQRPRRHRRQGPARRGGQGVRLRLPHRHRPARRGARPDRRPPLEAGLLRVAEGLLLRAQRQAADRRTPATSSTSSPASSASRATSTAPATP